MKQIFNLSIIVVFLIGLLPNFPVCSTIYAQGKKLGIVVSVLPKFEALPNSTYYSGGALGARLGIVAQKLILKKYDVYKDSINFNNEFQKFATTIGEELKKQGHDVIIINEKLDFQKLTKIKAEEPFYNYYVKDYCKAKGVDDLLILKIKVWGIAKIRDEYAAFIHVDHVLINGNSNMIKWKYEFESDCCKTFNTKEPYEVPSPSLYLRVLKMTFDKIKTQVIENFKYN